MRKLPNRRRSGQVKKFARLSQKGSAHPFLKGRVRIFLSERGSVEATLVLIPSMALFLCVLHIAFAVYQRNAMLLEVQEVATSIAVDGYTFETADLANSRSISTNIVSLPSGKTLVVTHSQRDRILGSGGIASFLGSLPLNVLGYAVSENN